ncbi:ferredoxin reductase [Acrocarpospora pleiomorpha]|uniref:Ferredoxin reductase n=1 Tax=Acrocarpospora pleiomorpha TaxID=90975 RepID=A0A5M3Y162_9ACTN|nr:FAD-dependent oxidoreductase [Acrocarpospora pleiomorpha]GES27065.1 ferredoxin reductase [Acrocarpospora pleiomorpha]
MTGDGLVVVGASLAGVRAAQAARRSGYTGPLTLVDADRNDPYDKPPLSKGFLAGDVADIPRLIVGGDRDRLDFEVRLGVAATALDPARKIVRTSAGDISYAKLLIATGSVARRLDVPGAHLAGIHRLRGFDDATALRAEIGPGRRAVVIGGGFIGLEVASSLLKLGVSVTLLEREPAIFANLGRHLSGAVARAFKASGGVVVESADVAGFEGGARLSAVVLADGSAYEADFAVVGVGSAPNIAWLAGSGIEVGDGIVCTERLETSVADVYAAGDLANWPSARFGRRLRAEHWTNAVMQGVVVGQNMAGSGKPQSFDAVPYFWSDFAGGRIQVAGVLGAVDSRERVVDDGDDLLEVLVEGDTIVAIAALNATKAFPKYRRLVGRSATEL